MSIQEKEDRLARLLCESGNFRRTVAHYNEAKAQMSGLSRPMYNREYLHTFDF